MKGKSQWGSLGARARARLGVRRGVSGAVLVVGAAMMPLSAMAQDETHSLGTSLFGEYEIGHDGAGEDAGGDFTGEIDMGAGTLCYYLEVYGLDTVTAAHLHKGGESENGPPVLTLEVLGEDGDEVCAEVEAELLSDIMANEEDYYVNVHTEAFPAGAVRGQLGG